MTVHILPLPDVPPPMPDAGLGALATEKGNLPLESVDIRATVTGLVAGIELAQGFRNPFDVPVEATYIFPMPDRAAVTAMRMEAADRVIEGRLEERGKARAEYDEAIAAGQRAAIAEEDRPDVFTMRVGNILPGENVIVRLALSQPLPYEDGAAILRFPLVVAPRYIPGVPLDDLPAGDGVRADTDAVPDASRISPPVLLPGFPSPVRLSLAVDLATGGLPLGDVRCSLHAVSADQDAETGRTTIRLQPGERLDRDFILRLGFAQLAETASLALTPDEGGAGQGTFTLTVLPPPAAATARPRDVVLVLDRSGSMGGWKIVAARRAAARIIDTLTAADRFAVLCFDHEIERPRDLGTGLADGTDRSRFRAVEHLAGLTARGGTEMARPLREAAGLLDDPVRDRVLVLITDGQIGNEDQILSQLGPLLSGVRVHTIGIDRAVNAGFLNRLAGLAHGRAELVESEDRLDEVMEHVHHRIAAPLVTGLSLSAGGDLRIEPDTVAPGRVGALYPGVPLVVSGRWQGSGDGTLTLSGTAADGTRWSQQVAPFHVTDRAATAIWARAHLRDLEDRYAVAASFDLEQRIIATSLRFGVLCRFTAFVAVDSRVVTDGGGPHRVVQPVEQPSGWEPAGPQTVAMAAMPPASGGAPRIRSALFDEMAREVRSAGTHLREALRPSAATPASMPAPPPAPGPVPPSGPAFPPPPAGPVPPAPVGAVPPAFAGPGAGAEGSRGASRPPALDALMAARRTAAEELARLITEAPAALPGANADGDMVRWTMLGDLRRRLDRLVADLAREGTPPETFAALVDLTRALAITDDPVRRTGLPELWDRTIRTLTAFTQPPPPSSSPRRHAFWKRS